MYGILKQRARIVTAIINHYITNQSFIKYLLLQLEKTVIFRM